MRFIFLCSCFFFTRIIFSQPDSLRQQIAQDILVGYFRAQLDPGNGTWSLPDDSIFYEIGILEGTEGKSVTLDTFLQMDSSKLPRVWILFTTNNHTHHFGIIDTHQGGIFHYPRFYESIADNNRSQPPVLMRVGEKIFVSVLDNSSVQGNPRTEWLLFDPKNRMKKSTIPWLYTKKMENNSDARLMCSTKAVYYRKRMNKVPDLILEQQMILENKQKPGKDRIRFIRYRFYNSKKEYAKALFQRQYRSGVKPKSLLTGVPGF